MKLSKVTLKHSSKVVVYFFFCNTECVFYLIFPVLKCFRYSLWMEFFLLEKLHCDCFRNIYSFLKASFGLKDIFSFFFFVCIFKGCYCGCIFLWSDNDGSEILANNTWKCVDNVSFKFVEWLLKKDSLVNMYSTSIYKIKISISAKLIVLHMPYAYIMANNYKNI